MTISNADIARDSAVQTLMDGGGCPTEAEVDALTAQYLAEMEAEDSEDVEPAAYSGPSPILVRQTSKQSWAQAKTLDALKDMAPARLADWVAGLNEVAGFAKYRVA